MKCRRRSPRPHCACVYKNVILEIIRRYSSSLWRFRNSGWATGLVKVLNSGIAKQTLSFTCNNCREDPSPLVSCCSYSKTPRRANYHSKNLTPKPFFQLTYYYSIFMRLLLSGFLFLSVSDGQFNDVTFIGGGEEVKVIFTELTRFFLDFTFIRGIFEK